MNRLLQGPYQMLSMRPRPVSQHGLQREHNIYLWCIVRGERLDWGGGVFSEELAEREAAVQAADGVGEQVGD
jgi:hypothetical protein